MGTSYADPTLAAGLPQVDGVEHAFVQIGALQVHIASAGEGEPVLLLHGWPQHWLMWRGVMERLSDRYRLIAPDLRGFGWSETPGDGYDCETFARDQVALLDTLEIERVKVIGHDWGGWTAFLLGLRYPQRIERMVICNVPHPWPRPRPRLVLSAWRVWYAILNAPPGLGPLVHRRGPYIETILRRGSIGEPFSDEEVGSYVARLREPPRAAAASALYRYYWRTLGQGVGGRWRSQRLSVPTLLLFGKRDLAIPYRLVESGFERHAPEMQLELVPDAGHFIVDEKPDLIAARALELFSGA